MPPTPQVIVTPKASVEQLAEAVIEIQRILTRGLGIGDAASGQEMVSKSVAGGAPRPTTFVGSADNLFGSLVEVTLTSPTQLNTNLVVTHNLSLPVPGDRVGTAGVSASKNQLLNVRWIVAGLRYLSDNGLVAPAATNNSVCVLYNNGLVGKDTIELKFYTDLTLGGAQNGQLAVTLFIFPSSG